MSITDDTLAAAQLAKKALDQHVDPTLDQLATAWGRAWNVLEPQWRTSLLALVATAEDGRWPSRWQIARAAQIQSALGVTRDTLDALAKQAGAVITDATRPLPASAVAWEARLTAMQLPSGLGIAFNRVSADALTAIIERSIGQITSLLAPLSADADRQMRDALIRGVALGRNPNVAAADMLARTRGAFDGGRVRAQRIARTEMLDAYRSAAQAQDEKSNVVASWVWLATLDERTCPSCLAMNGSDHPIDEPGPNDHVNGRCARVPITKSWKSLGFAQVEPDSILPDARAWFARQSKQRQVKIMGPQRLALLDSGDIGWDDLAMAVKNPGWRTSWQQRPVSDLRRLAAA